jgi:uncharacterized protein YjiS (DUF1127 family)
MLSVRLDSPQVRKGIWAHIFRAALAAARWWRIRRENARLSQYPDWMLKDIGLARGGISWAVLHGRENRGTPKIYPLALSPRKSPTSSAKRRHAGSCERMM